MAVQGKSIKRTLSSKVNQLVSLFYTFPHPLSRRKISFSNSAIPATPLIGPDQALQVFDEILNLVASKTLPKQRL